MSEKYIRIQDAKAVLQEKVFHNLNDEFYGAMQVLDELESADVIPVVRCKNCKHNANPPEAGNADCDLFYGMTEQYGFCHRAERRNDG